MTAVNRPGRHAKPTHKPLADGWVGRGLALLAAVLTMLAVVAYTERADAASTPKRHVAMNAAKSRQGMPYSYGAAGPSSFDCSGLVYWAYRKAGITLPRTTGGMLSSSKLQRVSAGNARWGDLVFASSGHVEFYGHGGSRGWMFGAHHSGTRIGYKRIYSGGSGWPRFYHVRGAG